ncbi:MAG TPA: glycosyltransferase family 1 protein [Roseiarcus sp.]
MHRPVVYDLTHLVSRLSTPASSGIDRVDLAYGAHFTSGDRRMAAGAHYGLARPHTLSLENARAIVDLAGAAWRDEGDGARCSALSGWLATPPAQPFDRRGAPARRVSVAAGLTRSLAKARFRLFDDRRLRIPDGAIYLNVAQHAFEHPVFFRWLDKRDDLRRVFLIHDLLSLDYPEYFPASNLALFRRRLATALRYADAFVVSTQAVAARLRAELERQGSPIRPIHVQPFASPLEGAAREAAHDGHPYFVVIGTIEPRKNHLLILHLWRQLAARDRDAPRLVIVGGRGWENEQIVDLLDRAPALRAHVVEFSGLPDADLSRLLCGARALLAPSFDEGYGLPVVEALSLGAPVAASDIPVFREVTQGRAKFLSPLDGPGWRDEIVQLWRDEQYYRRRGDETRRFVTPTWEGYFEGVRGFLETL